MMTSVTQGSIQAATMPETGGALVVAPWAVAILAGMVSLAPAATLGRLFNPSERKE